MLGLGLAIPEIAVRGGPNLDPAVSALITRMTATGTAPDAAHAAAINTLILALKAAGAWSLLDVLQIYTAQTSGHALLNWVSTSFNATAVNSPTFTANQGYQGNGTTSYVNTGFGTSAGSKFTQNSNFVFMWSNSTGLTGKYSGALSGGWQVVIGASTAATKFYASTNRSSAGADEWTSTDNASLIGVVRTGASSITGYSRGVNKGTASPASVALQSAPIFMGAYNNGGTPLNFNNTKVGVFMAGGGAGMDDTMALATYNALKAYMQAIGTGIVI